MIPWKAWHWGKGTHFLRGLSPRRGRLEHQSLNDLRCISSGSCLFTLKCDGGMYLLNQLGCRVEKDTLLRKKERRQAEFWWTQTWREKSALLETETRSYPDPAKQPSLSQLDHRVSLFLLLIISILQMAYYLQVPFSKGSNSGFFFLDQL